jgi:hypothetical protein
VRFDDFVGDGDDVHQREHARFAVVRTVDCRRIVEQLIDCGIALLIGGRVARVRQRVDVAVDQQIVDVLVRGHSLEIVPIGNLDGDLVLVVDHPLDLLGCDTVVLPENPSHPDPGGVLPAPDPDPSALQVGRFVDSGRGVDEVVTVSEYAVRKGGERSELPSAVDGREVRPERQLADVELLELEHPPVSLRRRECQHVRIDSLEVYLAVDDRAGSIQHVHRHREREVACHARSYRGTVHVVCPSCRS